MLLALLHQPEDYSVYWGIVKTVTFGAGEPITPFSEYFNFSSSKGTKLPSLSIEHLFHVDILGVFLDFKVIQDQRPYF